MIDRQRELLWRDIFRAWDDVADFVLSGEYEDVNCGIDAWLVYADGRRAGVALRDRVEDDPDNASRKVPTQQNLDEWKCQFTIRYALRSGGETEWHKVYLDPGDTTPEYTAYGWSKSAGQKLHTWAVLRVDTLREMIDGNILHSAYKYAAQSSGDTFAIYWLSDAKDALVDCSEHHPVFPHSPSRKTCLDCGESFYPAGDSVERCPDCLDAAVQPRRTGAGRAVGVVACSVCGLAAYIWVDDDGRCVECCRNKRWQT